MPLITFITAAGERQQVRPKTGVSLMQGAVENGIDAIVAECGGSCSCGTCHCYIDGEWADKAGRPDEFERALLEGVLDPQPNSRLSCQITVTDDLDGLVVRLPESQY